MKSDRSRRDRFENNVAAFDGTVPVRSSQRRLHQQTRRDHALPYLALTMKPARFRLGIPPTHCALSSRSRIALSPASGDFGLQHGCGFVDSFGHSMLVVRGKTQAVYREALEQPIRWVNTLSSSLFICILLYLVSSMIYAASCGARTASQSILELDCSFSRRERVARLALSNRIRIAVSVTPPVSWRFSSVVAPHICCSNRTRSEGRQ